MNKTILKTALSAWWWENFTTDYVIDRNGNYKQMEDCIEELVLRLENYLDNDFIIIKNNDNDSFSAS